jgi:hypothetical protein
MGAIWASDDQDWPRSRGKSEVPKVEERRRRGEMVPNSNSGR